MWILRDGIEATTVGRRGAAVVDDKSSKGPVWMAGKYNIYALHVQKGGSDANVLPLTHIARSSGRSAIDNE